MGKATTVKKGTKLWILLLCTFGFLLIYRLGAFVTLPFINRDFLQTNDLKLFGFLDIFSGGALSNFSVLCLGISPYITSSIVIQLLQMDIVPTLKEWSEEGETGKQKLNQLTRYIALILAFVQALILAIGVTTSYRNALFTDGVKITAFLYVYIALVATAGTAFTLWLAELISSKGIGNGTSILIVAGILASFPTMLGTLYTTYITGYDASTGLAEITTKTTANAWYFVLVLALLVIILVCITYMESATRKIPIQYANRPATASFRGKSDSNIPIKLNSASVIPVIFAATLMSIPTTVAGIVDPTGTTKFYTWINRIFNQTQAIGFILYIVLIFVFSFFYSFLQMSPEKMSDNLQKQNAYIPGIRPGNETASYISRVLFKITMIGATYLAIIAAIPVIMAWVIPNLPSSVQVGGTGLIIVVGVAIETAKQIKTQAQEKQYRGFIE